MLSPPTLTGKLQVTVTKQALRYYLQLAGAWVDGPMRAIIAIIHHHPFFFLLQNFSIFSFFSIFMIPAQFHHSPFFFLRRNFPVSSFFLIFMNPAQWCCGGSTIGDESTKVELTGEAVVDLDIWEDAGNGS